jgi:prepilin-type N-terminal cleavage/methylation domain-containing protein
MTSRKTHSIARLAGFTLVELLVVISIVTVLAAISLPTLKNGLREQRVSRSAGLIQQYIEEARARAIANRRPVGVILQRAGTDNEINRCQVDRLRLCETPPVYVGDISGAKARLKYVASPAKYVQDRVDNSLGNNNQFTLSDGSVINMRGVIVLQFEPLNAFLLNAVLTAGHDSIRVGDFIMIGEFQLPRRIVDIRPELPRSTEPWLPVNTQDDPVSSPDVRVEIVVEHSPLGWEPATLASFTPDPGIPNFGLKVPFKIYRQPIPSYAPPLEISDKTVIDLLYSGTGVFGTEFSPLTMENDYTATSPVFNAATRNYGDIWIVFGPDGSVLEMFYGGGDMPVIRTIPVSDIFLLVGRTGQVRPDAPLTPDGSDTPNILDGQSIWISINRMTGNLAQHLVSVPDPIPATTVPGADIANAVGTSREFARFSGYAP